MANGTSNSGLFLGATGWVTASLANFTESVNSSSPNATVPVATLTPNNASTHVDFVMKPKGDGSILASTPDGTATGGNKRGVGSVDFQTVRGSAGQVTAAGRSAITGGSSNTILVAATWSVIGGGSSNTINDVSGSGGTNSVIGGGGSNSTNGNYATLVGGQSNSSYAHDFVGGGQSNNSGSVGTHNVICGGQSNQTSSGSHAAVCGGSGNDAMGQYSFIGGGLSNLASIAYGTVCGGNDNSAIDLASTVCGGNTNTCGGQYAFIGGGNTNVIQGGSNTNYSVISGGWNNTVNSSSSTNACTISGGNSNTITGGSGAVISGGSSNAINSGASYSWIPGGQYAVTRGIQGMGAWATDRFTTSGDAQRGEYLLMRATTDATQSELSTFDGAPSTSAHRIVLPNNHAYGFTGKMVARSSTGDMAVWEIKGAVKRGANAAATSIVGTPTVTMLFFDAGAATWALAVDADTTNGSLRLQVTGVAATNINWLAEIETLEIG